MKSSLFAAAMTVACLATPGHAASVVWQTPQNISGTSDVSLQGNYFGSWAPNDAGASAFPVAGISFQGFSDLPGLTNNLDDGGQFFGGQGTSDSNYNTLLSYGRYVYSTDSRSFSWGGMTSGNTYLLEVWISDPRSIGSSRSATLSGDGDTSPSLSYPSDGTGKGQYIIGTFVAGADGTQTITIDPSQNGDPSAGSAQINLLLVRDLGVVPEPASASLLGVGLIGLLARRRRI